MSDQISNLRISESFSKNKIEELIADNILLEKQINSILSKLNGTKLPLLVRKQIFDENRELLGEGFIEEEMALNLEEGGIDVLFGETAQSSSAPLLSPSEID